MICNIVIARKLGFTDDAARLMVHESADCKVR